MVMGGADAFTALLGQSVTGGLRYAWGGCAGAGYRAGLCVPYAVCGMWGNLPFGDLRERYSGCWSVS